MFKAIADSRHGQSAEQAAAIMEAIDASWIEPTGTTFAGPGELASQEFQESLRTIYRCHGLKC